MSEGYTYTANAYLQGVEFHKKLTSLNNRTSVFFERMTALNNLRSLKVAIESYGLSSSLVGFVATDKAIYNMISSFPAVEDLDNIPLADDHPVVAEVTTQIDTIVEKEEELVVQYLEEAADDLTVIFQHLAEQLPGFRECLDNLTDELAGAVGSDATLTIVPFGREQERLDTLAEILSTFEIPVIDEESDVVAIADTVASLVEKLNSVISVDLVEGQIKVNPTAELFELEEVSVADALTEVEGLAASIDNLIGVLQLQAQKRGAEHVENIEDIVDDVIDESEVVDPTIDDDVEDAVDPTIDDTPLIAEATEDLDDVVDPTNPEDDAVDGTPAAIIDDLTDGETTPADVTEEVTDVVEETGTVVYTAAIFVQILVTLIDTSLKTLNSALGALDTLASNSVVETDLDDSIDPLDEGDVIDDLVDDILDGDVVDPTIEDDMEDVVDPTVD